MGDVVRLTNLTTGGPVHVDVQGGKILRIVPLELDDSDGLRGASMRGGVISRPRAALPWRPTSSPTARRSTRRNASFRR